MFLMAEKRMLSKVISVSEKINTLPDILDMLLFTWMIPHADDFGRLAGSPAKVKALVVPMLDRSINDVKQSLERLSENGVILWYEVDGEKLIEIVDFDRHQNGLKNKKQKFRPPTRHLTSNNSYLSASEAEIEEMIANKLTNNEFFSNETVVSVEQQLRIENSYIDILATCSTGQRYLLEIKRQRLSNASIEQILKYRTMLKDPNVRCMLIGNGLSSNFDYEKCESEHISVLVYDDSLTFDAVMLFDVNCQDLLLLSNRTELNRTEQEQNGTRTETNSGSGGFKEAYRLFEQEGFGTISPILSDQIEDIIITYGFEWYQRATKVAVLAGKKSLSYVEGILKRWRASGIQEPWREENPGEEFKGRTQNVRSGENQGKSEYDFLDQQNSTGGQGVPLQHL